MFRTGGQIGNNDSADDVRNVDLTRIHYLTGPFEIEGAQPGDLLLVEIMDVQVRILKEQPMWHYFIDLLNRTMGNQYTARVHPSGQYTLDQLEKKNETVDYRRDKTSKSIIHG